MQHHLYNPTAAAADTMRGGDETNHTGSNSDHWHGNIWQHRSNTTPSSSTSTGRLSSLPPLPPVTSSTSSLLQSRYYPSSNSSSTYNTLPSSTSFYQPYPTTSTSSSTTSTLPRSSSSSSLYRQSNNFMSKPVSRPRLTTTLWEDESTLCYQVDSRGICVARRQDNDMINGTKLLNVAGMSRGKRDGILKNERGRIVVKVGAMHLKGVWIPFVRAKALASQFKIIDILYPIFSDDPASFLYPSHFHQMHRYTNSLNTSSRPTATIDHHSYSRHSPYNATPSISLLTNRLPETNSVVDSNKSYAETSNTDIYHSTPSRGLYYSQQQATDHATGSSSTCIPKRTDTSLDGKEGI